MMKQNKLLVLRCISICILSCLFISTSIAEKTARIVGGTTSQVGAWPWMAGLSSNDFFNTGDIFCGATLIAEDWVLTAAHCVFGKSIYRFDVVINRADLTSNEGEKLPVVQIITHPLFNHITLENDLALIKLAQPSQFTPIKLVSPYSFQDDADKSAIVLGWGTLSATEGIFPDKLQQAELLITDNASCSLIMNNGIFDVTDDMLCAGDNFSIKDSCQGDSGGPLIVFDTESFSWRQVGITSWGIGCALPNTYGVYTRLENYAEFISDTICSVAEKPAAVELELSTDGNQVITRWSEAGDISGYRLNYAPFPLAEHIFSVDMNQATEFSVELEQDSAFYVAITSYKGNCLSTYSNVESFIIE